MSYEGSNDEEEIKTIPVIHQNNNNNYNVVNDSESQSNNWKNLFDEDFDVEVKATLKITINAKVVHAMKKLQALYNNNVNKIVNKAAQEKTANKNWIFSLTWSW